MGGELSSDSSSARGVNDWASSALNEPTPGNSVSFGIFTANRNTRFGLNALSFKFLYLCFHP